jgi:ComF family protein
MNLRQLPCLTDLLAGLGRIARAARQAGRLLPGCCALCGSSAATAICAACCDRYLRPGGPRCGRCAAPLAVAGTDCGRCLRHAPAFDASVTATSYAAPVDLLVQALKFRAQLALAPAFAQLLLDALASKPAGADALMIAVPLSSERLAARGFNQALEIAKPLARALGLPLALHACVRVRDTAPQSGLAPADRRDNMRGAFAVMQRQAIAGKHLLVVDDVMTTGHTLDALAACLKRNGAVRVTNLIFARTPP